MQMQGLITISVRDFLRNYKVTFKKVASSGSAVVVTNKQTPQVAVVPVQALEEIRNKTELEKTRNLLAMAKEAEKVAKKYKIKGPRDLSINHDKYAWGPYE